MRACVRARVFISRAPPTSVFRTCKVARLYKILFCFKALLCESIILLLPPPSCTTYTIVILFHAHCVIYAPPPTLPFYAIHHTILVMAILCKCQNVATTFLDTTRRPPH